MTKPTRSTAAGRAYLDLQNRARRERRGTQELLTMYVVERWLARLSRSAYVDDFVLKGGMLLASYGARRPTVDADALARNLAADQDSVLSRVTEIATIVDPDDGVEFLTETVTAAAIRDNAVYSGVRVVMDARIASAKMKLRLDINFGDPVTPAPHPVELPPLRPGLPPVRVLGYPMETVLAEKLAMAIQLGAASTRVRDWADIYVLTGSHGLRFGEVRQALEATMAFRGVALAVLSAAAGALVQLRSSAYLAYRSNLGVDGAHLPVHFDDVVQAVISFADPLLEDTEPSSRWNPVTRRWEISDAATVERPQA